MTAQDAGGFSGLLDPGRRQHTEPRGPGVALAGLHLLVLWSFVAVQPLLDLLGDTPEFFVARQNTRGDILVLAFALTLVPPAVATALEAAARRISPPAQRGMHLALVGRSSWWRPITA